MTYGNDLDTNLALKEFGLVRLCAKQAPDYSTGRCMSVRNIGQLRGRRGTSRSGGDPGRRLSRGGN